METIKYYNVIKETVFKNKQFDSSITATDFVFLTTIYKNIVKKTLKMRGKYVKTLEELKEIANYVDGLDIEKYEFKRKIRGDKSVLTNAEVYRYEGYCYTMPHINVVNDISQRMINSYEYYCSLHSRYSALYEKSKEAIKKYNK